MPKRRRGGRTGVGRTARHVGFDRLVERSVATIPSPFREALAEVAIVIDDEPTPEQRRDNGLADDEMLYGLYEGVPEPSTAPTGPRSPTGSRCSGCRSRKTSPIPATSPRRSG